MLKQPIEKALNEQIQAELYSSYLYYAMSAYLETKGLPGAASWMRVQALEEVTHADKIFKYINDRGGRVQLAQIDAPQAEWSSPLAAFEAAYGHEVTVTERINKLVDIAREHSDHSTYNFLQWFVAEQVEEEATASEIIDKLKLTETGGGGMFILDRDLATRTFAMPASEED